MACPVHFSEPSGQVARGQLCIGTGFPSAPVSANEVPAATVPCGQGTPQVVPGTVAGLLSSQRNSRAGVSPDAAAAKRTRTARDNSEPDLKEGERRSFMERGETSTGNAGKF